MHVEKLDWMFHRISYKTLKNLLCNWNSLYTHAFRLTVRKCSLISTLLSNLAPWKWGKKSAVLVGKTVYISISLPFISVCTMFPLKGLLITNILNNKCLSKLLGYPRKIYLCILQLERLVVWGLDYSHKCSWSNVRCKNSYKSFSSLAETNSGMQ